MALPKVSSRKIRATRKRPISLKTFGRNESLFIAFNLKIFKAIDLRTDQHEG